MIELLKIKPFPLLENGISTTSDIFNYTDTTSGTTGRIFEKGKKYLITAPSGKGKSTLLHLMYGLRQDYEGTIKIDNRDIKTLKADDWANIRQKKLSIVFQDLRLFLNLTAKENILLKSQLTDTTTSQGGLWTESEVEAMCEQLGIAPVLNQTCETLSYGQRQRVAIIRALCQPFDMLLLDELFSNLDTENIKIATQLINKACAANGAGLVLVSLGDEYYFEYDEKLTL